MNHKIISYDQSLAPFEGDLDLRMDYFRRKKAELLSGGASCLADIANGHMFYGLHKENGGWYYREWAPAAEKMYFTGDFCGWDRYCCPMENKGGGV